MMPRPCRVFCDRAGLLTFSPNSTAFVTACVTDYARISNYPEWVIPARITQSALRLLDRLATNDNKDGTPAHLRTGRRGEEDAYFHLRRRGYVMIARNYRNARHHGEVDLIGWDKNVLCFIEVKTRTTRDVKPAEAAVDRKKRHDLRTVIRGYLRSLPETQFPEPPPWRFDVLTVYYDQALAPPTFELFQNAALSS